MKASHLIIGGLCLGQFITSPHLDQTAAQWVAIALLWLWKAPK